MDRRGDLLVSTVSSALVAAIILLLTLYFQAKSTERQEQFEERLVEQQQEFEQKQREEQASVEDDRHASTLQAEDVRFVRNVSTSKNANPNFQGMDISGGVFNGIEFQCAAGEVSCANFATGNLVDSQFMDANLSKARFDGADLTGARLDRANLSYVNFAGSELANADLRGADLTGASLKDANLAESNLYGANLSATLDLETANIRGACYDGSTNWPAGFVVPPADQSPRFVECMAINAVRTDISDKEGAVYGYYEE